MVLRPISSIARTVSLESSRVEKGTLSEDEEADSAAIMGEREFWVVVKQKAKTLMPSNVKQVSAWRLIRQKTERARDLNILTPIAKQNNTAY
jgi:hypothetical protein